MNAIHHKDHIQPTLVPVPEQSDNRVSRYRELVLQKKRIEEEMEELKLDLLSELEEGQVMFSPDGIGYRKAIRRVANYGNDAIQAVTARGIANEFVKISDAKLKDLAKSGVISRDELLSIQAMAEIKESEYLQEVVDKEKRVF